MPVWYFGTWPETKYRWSQEGLAGIALTGDAGPEIQGMDPDWEAGMWDLHGLAVLYPLSADPLEVLERGAGYRVVRTPLGAVIKESVGSSSIPLHIEEALQPTRSSWQRFKKFLDPADPLRRAADWENKAAALNQRERVTTFHAGSLFAWIREWMGVEQMSYLAHDDPRLYEEMIEYVAEYFMAICGPILRKVEFDFAYFFEDCCGSSGPLFSPATYRKFYHRYYVKMIDFYRSLGVRTMMLDSDGKTDPLIPCWLDSGFDVIFPIEVGKWQADPARLRQQYGRRLRMMGGVNKHLIPLGAPAIRAHLQQLKLVTDEGGYIPLPDHRIPPDCSLEQFREYIRVFQEVFNAPGNS
jgi:uroporphyrinogen decarboxylase